MLDKLSLASLQLVTQEQACRRLQGHYDKIISTRTKYHNKVLIFSTGPDKKNDHLLTLHCEQVSAISHPTIAVFNPSKFKSYESILTLLKLLFDDPANLKIIRIDHAVDICFEVQRVRNTFRWSRKKSREVYRDGKILTGIYIGNCPERLAIYDKARESKVDGPLTRVELRQFNKKIPIRLFSELPTLQYYNPFEKLIIEKVAENSNSLNKKDKFKQLALKNLILEGGMQGAYKLLNVHSNFNRDFKNQLEPDTEIPNLDELYQNNLSRFFNMNFIK